MTGRFALGRMFAVLPAIMLASGLAAAGPAPVGSLVGSMDAVLDGRPPLPHTAILSGDRLDVNDGLAMIALGRGNRMVLVQGSEASFLRDGDSITVLLVRGGMSILHPQAGGEIKVVAGGAAIHPAAGSKTLCEIAMLDGLLVITAKDGALDVERAGSVRRVTQGGTITIAVPAAQSQAPAPSARQHVKHIFNHKKLVIGALAAGGTGAAVAAIAFARSSKEVSPTVPSF